MKNNIKNYKANKKSGFTLIEILVVIGIIAILSAVVLVAINPARQFKLARDSQRVANVTAILNAVGQNMAEHKGTFDCTIALPSTDRVISSATDGLNIASCLVPTYVSSLPFDPSKSGAKFTSITDYDSGYSILIDTDGRVKVSAVGEITPDIYVTR
jgi:type IV pilus assembly protein PilA